MKSFNSFLNSLNEEKLDYHHTSINKINSEEHSSSEHPMWLSHSAHQAKGWHNIVMDQHNSAHTYSAKVNGNIANHTDDKVKTLFQKHKIDQDEYHGDLASNPDSNKVHKHPATQLLKKHGYVGYSHPDYNPHDFEKDHDSTVVFHRKNIKLKLKKTN